MSLNIHARLTKWQGIYIDYCNYVENGYSVYDESRGIRR